MENLNTLFVFGVILGIGAISSRLFRLIKLPQVIGHIIVGVILGVSGLKLLNTGNLPLYKVVADLALGLIGFSIGGELRWARLKRFGTNIFLITCFESLFATLLVGSVVYFFSNNLPLALILGSLAAATAPGGTTNILQEYRTRGPLTTNLLGVVGADDAFAIVIYALSANISKALLSTNTHFQIQDVFHIITYDVFGSIILGAILGIIVSIIMLKVKYDDMKRLVILTALFLCTGLAEFYQLSFILSTMSMGIIIGNIRPHRSKTYFNAIQLFAPPIFILFFVLIGARLNISLLPSMGFIGILYIVFRLFGKYTGAFIGATLSKSPKTVQKYLGLCLFSQAGVAIGLAMSAQIELQNISVSAGQMGSQILNLITATTLVFQIIGPIFTKYALFKANEIRIHD